MMTDIQAVKGPAEIHHCIYCQRVIAGVHQGEGVGADGKQVFSCNECWQSNFIKKLYQEVTAAEARIAELEAALSGSPQVEAGTVPKGWMMVPIEPTPEMLRAYRGALKQYIDALPDDVRLPGKRGLIIDDTIKAKVRFAAMCTAARAHPAPLTIPREQEGEEAPVAWLTEGDDGDVGLSQTKPAPHYFSMPKYRVTPLYAHPPLPADGWKEGIEAAAKVAEDDADDRVGIAGHRIALKIRALLTTPPASTEGGK